MNKGAGPAFLHLFSFDKGAGPAFLHLALCHFLLSGR